MVSMFGSCGCVALVWRIYLVWEGAKPAVAIGGVHGDDVYSRRW